MLDGIKEILGSSEFVAALTGGLLAAAGSFLSLRWQHAATEKAKRRNVAVFFAEQAVHSEVLLMTAQTASKAKTRLARVYESN